MDKEVKKLYQQNGEQFVCICGTGFEKRYKNGKDESVRFWLLFNKGDGVFKVFHGTFTDAKFDEFSFSEVSENIQLGSFAKSSIEIEFSLISGTRIIMNASKNYSHIPNYDIQKCISAFKEEIRKSRTPAIQQVDKKKDFEDTRSQQTSVFLEEADILYQKGVYDEAIQSYLQASETNRRNYQIHYSIAKCYVHLKQFDFALKSFDKAIKLSDNKNEDLEKEFAQLLYQNGAFKEALSIISKHHHRTDDELSLKLQTAIAAQDFYVAEDLVVNNYRGYKKGVLNAISNDNIDNKVLTSKEYSDFQKRCVDKIKESANSYESSANLIFDFLKENNLESKHESQVKTNIETLKNADTLKETINRYYACKEIVSALNTESFEVLRQKEHTIGLVKDYINKFDFALNNLDEEQIKNQLYERLQTLKYDFGSHIDNKDCLQLLPKIEDLKKTVDGCKKMEELVVEALLNKGKSLIRSDSQKGIEFMSAAKDIFSNEPTFNDEILKSQSRNKKKLILITTGIFVVIIIFVIGVIVLSAINEKKAEDELWELSKSRESYTAYLIKYPDGRYKNQAWNNKIENEWNNVVTNSTVEKIDRYLESFNNPLPVKTIQRYENKDLSKITFFDVAGVILEDCCNAEYIEIYKKIPHENEALSLLEDIEWKKVEESSSIKEIEQFINENPSNKNVPKAHELLENLQQYHFLKNRFSNIFKGYDEEIIFEDDFSSRNTFFWEYYDKWDKKPFSQTVENGILKLNSLSNQIHIFKSGKSIDINPNESFYIEGTIAIIETKSSSNSTNLFWDGHPVAIGLLGGEHNDVSIFCGFNSEGILFAGDYDEYRQTTGLFDIEDTTPKDIIKKGYNTVKLVFHIDTFYFFINGTLIAKKKINNEYRLEKWIENLNTKKSIMLDVFLGNIKAEIDKIKVGYINK